MGLSAKEIRALCEVSFLPAMSAALQQVFRAADAAVTQLAVAAASNADQNRYFEAVQGLRIVRPELIEHFSRRLLLPLVSEPVPDWPVETAHVDSLRSLLSINLELWRADTTLAAAVLDLQQRLAVIDPALQNPLAPEHVVDSFLQSLAEARLDIHTKMLMVRMFEAQLYAKLERYVCMFNDELIALDVLPALATRPGELETTINALVGEVMGQDANHAIDSDARLVSAALADLQAAYVEDMENMLGVGAILAVVAAPPVRDLVAELREHKLLPEAVSPAMQLQLDKIVMVSKLFRYLVDDSNLPIEARALLVNLQLPYARIALADAALLNNSRHPARALLNEITAVCAEWQPGSHALAIDELFLRLQATVQLFLEAERIETINYQQLLFEYLAFAEGQRQSSLTVTRRIMDSQIGAEVADTVRDAVNKILLKRTSHARIPGAVRRLLDEGWSHVLYMTALQKGLAAAEWELALQVVDRLLCSVQPATAFASRSAFIMQLPSLLRELRKGLQFINASPLIINQLLADLEEVHKQIVRDIPGDFADLEKLVMYKHESGLSMETEESVAMSQAEYAVRSAIVFSAEELQELAVEAVETVKAGARDIFSAKTLEVVAGLGPGVSLLWRRDGMQLRCRVAAHIKHTKKFIITDRSGLKLAELSEYDMMQKIDSAEMETMVSEQLFDRALESVIGNIRDLR